MASAGLQSANELISAASERQFEVYLHIYGDYQTKIETQKKNSHLPLVDYHEQQRKGGIITQTIIYFD